MCKLIILNWFEYQCRKKRKKCWLLNHWTKCFCNNNRWTLKSWLHCKTLRTCRMLSCNAGNSRSSNSSRYSRCSRCSSLCNNRTLTTIINKTWNSNSWTRWYKSGNMQAHKSLASLCSSSSFRANIHPAVEVLVSTLMVLRLLAWLTHHLQHPKQWKINPKFYLD